jgi:hypothetical protein
MQWLSEEVSNSRVQSVDTGQEHRVFGDWVFFMDCRLE